MNLINAYQIHNLVVPATEIKKKDLSDGNVMQIYEKLHTWPTSEKYKSTMKDRHSFSAIPWDKDDFSFPLYYCDWL